MALRIRLQRHGNRHNPYYRIVVAESSARRDGRFVEWVGTYDPRRKNSQHEYQVNLERVDYWEKVGAKPSETVRSLIRKARRHGGGSPEEVPAAAPAEEPSAASAPVAEASTPAAAEASPAEEPAPAAGDSATSADEAKSES
jgi:small subunit ribosomal protein S16